MLLCMNATSPGQFGHRQFYESTRTAHTRRFASQSQSALQFLSCSDSQQSVAPGSIVSEQSSNPGSCIASATSDGFAHICPANLPCSIRPSRWLRESRRMQPFSSVLLSTATIALMILSGCSSPWLYLHPGSALALGMLLDIVCQHNDA